MRLRLLLTGALLFPIAPAMAGFEWTPAIGGSEPHYQEQPAPIAPQSYNGQVQKLPLEQIPSDKNTISAHNVPKENSAYSYQEDLQRKMQASNRLKNTLKMTHSGPSEPSQIPQNLHTQRAPSPDYTSSSISAQPLQASPQRSVPVIRQAGNSYADKHGKAAHNENKGYKSYHYNNAAPAQNSHRDLSDQNSGPDSRMPGFENKKMAKLPTSYTQRKEKAVPVDTSNNNNAHTQLDTYTHTHANTPASFPAQRPVQKINPYPQNAQEPTGLKRAVNPGEIKQAFSVPGKQTNTNKNYTQNTAITMHGNAYAKAHEQVQMAKTSQSQAAAPSSAKIAYTQKPEPHPAMQQPLNTIEPASSSSLPARSQAINFSYQAEQPKPKAALVEGFGADMPLAYALTQIVPAHYAYSFGEGVNPAYRVSWSGGKPWQDVVDDMIAPIGLISRIQDKKLIIERVAGNHVKPMALNAPQTNAKTAAQSQPRSDTATPASVVRINSKPNTHASPLQAKVIERYIKRNNVRDPGPQQARQPQKIVMTNNAPQSLKNASFDFIDAPSSENRPESSVFASQQIKTWSATPGESLRSTLGRWSSKVNVGMVWNVPHDYEVPASLEMTGNYQDAVNTLLSLSSTVTRNKISHRIETHEGSELAKTLVVNKLSS